MTLLCRIGFHDWDQPAQPSFGDRRTCKRCGKTQELVVDGIWNSGEWIDVRDEE